MTSENTRTVNDSPSERDSEDDIPLELQDHVSDDKDNGERRKLRSLYRKLINDFQGSEDLDNEVASNDFLMEHLGSKLIEKLDVVDQLYPKVKHTREAALDSQVYNLITLNAKHKVQSLKADLTQFVPEEFAEKLKTFLDVDRVEYPDGLSNDVWLGLGRSTSGIFKRTPTYHFFSGTFGPEDVLPKVIQRKPRAAKDDGTQKPTAVQQIAHNEKDYSEKTTEEVENVLQTLHRLYKKNKRQPLCYFQLVVDPESFSKTIENIFHMSFLVKDGEVRVFYDEYKLPVVVPLEKKPTGDSANEKYALALGLSYPEWQEVKTAFGIKQAAFERKSGK